MLWGGLSCRCNGRAPDKVNCSIYNENYFNSNNLCLHISSIALLVSQEQQYCVRCSRCPRLEFKVRPPDDERGLMRKYHVKSLKAYKQEQMGVPRMTCSQPHVCTQNLTTASHALYLQYNAITITLCRNLPVVIEKR